jgi:hypothetical protein
MLRTRKRHAEVFLFEQDGTTRADVALKAGETTMHGYGSARCRPGEADVPEIGDELATGRALADLGRKLIEVTTADLEQQFAEQSAQGPRQAADPH